MLYIKKPPVKGRLFVWVKAVYSVALMMRNILIAALVFHCSLLTAQPNLQQHFYVRTTGQLPYLEYGIGDDRLGGAKMTYLDTMILLKVVDSFKTDYKVQLANQHSAYIDKAFVSPVAYEAPLQHLSSSWKCYGDSLFDYVTVSLDERLPYTSVQQIGPSRIVVDIFGVTSNTNWITQLSSAKEIKNAWYEQITDDVMRVFIELKHAQHWGHSVYYEKNKLVVKIKRQPEKLNLKNMLIAVDAGHGGTNLGANGISTNILEKNYTLLIAQQLQLELEEKGASVFMIRDHDTTLSMNERVLMAKEKNPDLLVSIHLNSSSKDSISGVSTYYRYIGFRPLSTAILKQMLDLGLSEFGNIGNFNFTLNGPTDYPNCLVEVAFLSNKEDEKKILDPVFHTAVAQKIVAGIEAWLKDIKKQDDK